MRKAMSESVVGVVALNKCCWLSVDTYKHDRCDELDDKKTPPPPLPLMQQPDGAQVARPANNLLHCPALLGCGSAGGYITQRGEANGLL